MGFSITSLLALIAGVFDPLDPKKFFPTIPKSHRAWMDYEEELQMEKPHIPGKRRKVPFFIGNWIAGFRGF